ncbi:MAG: hypothetical protein JWO02_397 [Solirubrobacterales bacterium]|nr:hypothetical protein [Solirubrobacterales bacterium]
MIHADLRALAALQDDVVASWQLIGRRWTKAAVRHRTAGLRRLNGGVFLLGHAEPTQRQCWRAATLTAPNTALSHFSGGAAHQVRPWSGAYETVTRPGNGGPRRYGGVLVMHSLVLDGHLAMLDGLPVTTAERVLADLTPVLDDRALRKAFREALRLKATTAGKVQRLADRYPHRRGSRRLAAVAGLYVRLPIHRCRSDAEAMALEVLDAAGVPIPEVNRRFAGEEADLCWPALRLIIEIDGPQFHRFKDEDARKTAAWRAAGYDVRRIPSGDVFDHPARLLAIAPRPA